MSAVLDPQQALVAAVNAAGSQSALAKVCGCTPANISQLICGRKVLPARFVLNVEAATGVSRHDLRPDLYPPGLGSGPYLDPHERRWRDAERELADARSAIQEAPSPCPDAVMDPLMDRLFAAERALVRLPAKNMHQAVRRLEVAIIDGPLKGVDLEELIIDLRGLL
jgi:DNA-binding transcriptional regulator YdaS (Cro superfamily)